MTTKKTTDNKKSNVLAMKKPAPKKVASNAKKKTATKKPAAKAKPQAQPKAKAKNQSSQQKLNAFMNETNTILKNSANPMETIMTQNKTQFDQFTKDANAASREAIEAVTQSGAIFAQGFETIFRETMTFAQSAAEKQMQFAKEAMGVKTINEFSDIQNKIVQSSFDDAMTNVTKLTELGTKTFTDAIEPINNQVTKTVQQATDAVAAE